MLTFRPASEADISLLRRWDDEDHVVVSDPNDDWLWEIELQRQPAWREQWIAEYNKNPIGFLQIIDPQQEESHYWGDIGPGYRAIDIWIGEAGFLGKGYGTRMMEFAIRRCFTNESVDRILIDPLASNTRAHRFYERLGFRFLREQQFGADHCYVYYLSKAEWDIISGK